MYQRQFWKGEAWRHHGREDTIRGNREAPPMHEGPGEFDMSMGSGADSPHLGTSQPRVKGNKPNDEIPLKHANVKPHRRLHQVLMAHALRYGPDGTTMGTAVGGGAAGGGAGGGT
jgi:hypothetical protein